MEKRGFKNVKILSMYVEEWGRVKMFLQLSED
jgi:ribosomal protein S18